MKSIQEIEEDEFGRGPKLWDATPGVCCAAYQLGACEHTEANLDYDEFQRAYYERTHDA